MTRDELVRGALQVCAAVVQNDGDGRAVLSLAKDVLAGMAINTLSTKIERSRNAERQKRYRDKRNALRESNGESNVTRNVSSNGSKTPSDSPNSAEEEKSRSEFRANSAELENSEKRESLETRVTPTVTRNADRNAPSNGNGNGNADARTPWLRVLDVWVEHAHGGKSPGLARNFKAECESILKAAEARRSSDPIGLCREVIPRYIADRRAKGSEVNIRFLAKDFAGEAERKSNGNGSAPVTPELAEYRRIKAERAAALKASDNAKVNDCELRMLEIQKGWDNARRL